MWQFIISFAGLVVGMFLAWLVPEELEAGKKYFYLVQQGLLFSLLAVSFFFLRSADFIFLLPLFFGVVLFFLNFYRGGNKEKPNIFFPWIHSVLHSLLPYFIFAIPYFQNSLSAFRLIIASLLFLYGLPTGTLLWDRLEYIKRN